MAVVVVSVVFVAIYVVVRIFTVVPGLNAPASNLLAHLTVPGSLDVIPTVVPAPDGVLVTVRLSDAAVARIRRDSTAGVVGKQVKELTFSVFGPLSSTDARMVDSLGTQRVRLVDGAFWEWKLEPGATPRGFRFDFRLTVDQVNHSWLGSVSFRSKINGGAWAYVLFSPLARPMNATISGILMIINILVGIQSLRQKKQEKASRVGDAAPASAP